MKSFAGIIVCLAAASLSLAQNNAGAKEGQKPKISRGEAQAVNAMIQAQTPDDRIKAAEDLLSKYADTTYKDAALELEAESYQQKGDNDKAIVFGEQALAANPMNYQADILLANVYAATTKDTDLDKDQKLEKASKYAHDGITSLDSAENPNPKSNPEEKWTAFKKAEQAEAYQALGTVEVVKKKYDDAVAQYQKGADLDPSNALLMVRAGRALFAAKRYDDAIQWDEKAMNVADAPTQIKQIAQADRARALQAKGAVKQ